MQPWVFMMLEHRGRELEIVFFSQGLGEGRRATKTVLERTAVLSGVWAVG